MARKKKSRIDRIMDDLKGMLPDDLVPDSYLRDVIVENEEISESDEELMAETKIQLLEEAGADLPMTRKEAEAYLYDEISDMQWDSISHEDLALTSQIRMIEDSCGKTLLQMLREMPLVPAARMISSIVAGYLRGNDVELTPQKEEEITNELIHSLGSSFSDLAMQLLPGMDSAGESGHDSDWDMSDFDLDIFPEEAGQPPQKESDHTRRRSRITKFPGK